ncbi:MAG TPA: YDG domain-containing protein, partial [Burkholderiales bacterium]|nr:YDG domain-containing protein [Burkholderiales bacterium]
VYDGTSSATVNTAGAVFGGKVAGDDVTVSATGTFADKNAGSGKTVTLSSTDGGADAGNYTITNQAGTTADITPRTLTVSGLTVADRSYDGTSTASVVTGSVQYAGLVAGDSFSLSSSAGSFANKNVGTAKTVTLSNTYGGTDTGNYTVVDQGTTTASITPATLTLSAANASKTYDGTTGVSGGSAVVKSGTLFSGDTLSGGTFAYTDKDAGVGSKVVTVSGVTVNDGNSGGNYTVSYADNVTSTINKANLTVGGITAADKVYDATTNATISTAGASYAGLVAGDQLTATVSGHFSDANVGAGKTVTLSSSYGGADVGNYNISSQPGTTASISRAALTVTANNDARFVTQSDTPGYNGVNYSGFVGGETQSSLNLSGLAVNRPNAGTDVSAGTYSGALVPSGVVSGNYAISYVNGDYTILGANNALVKTVNTSTTYGSAPSYSVTSVQYMNGSNVIGTLTQNSASGNSYVYGDGAGGTLSFTLNPSGAVLSSSGRVAVGNYGIADASPVVSGPNLVGPVTFVGNLAVQAAPVTATAGGVSKVYDGTAAMSNVTLNLSGQFGGDTVTVSGNGAFSQKNVGTGLSYSVTGLTLGGGDGGNYYLSGGSSLSGSNGSITPKAVTISGIAAADKVYDAGTGASVNIANAIYTGLITNDDVAVSATGVFGDKNVGNAKTVTLTSSYVGADIGNYSFVDQATTTASITPKGLTVSGLSVANRDYNGSAVATVDVSGANFAGLIAGDVVHVSATGSYADKNAATNKTVTLSSSYSGADAGNYSITSQATATGDIAPAAISVSIANVSKVYDGGTGVGGVTRTLSSGTLYGGDSLTGGSFAYSDKNVGAGNKTVLVSGVGVSDGNGGGNYVVTDLNNTTSSITARPITMSGITATSKVYDGTLTANVSTAGASYAGLVAGDDVLVTATGVYGNKNVGTGKTVTLTSSYSGADAGNYSITSQATTTGDITPKNLTVSGLAVANRVYDGTTVASVDVTGANYAGLVGGDVVHVGATGTYADKNAGMNKTVTLSSSYSGADAGNYSITSQATTTGDIVAKAVTVSGITAAGKVYDGNSNASVSTGGAVVAGLISGDLVTVSATGQFDSKNAGTGKTVTLTSTYGGSDAANYSFTDQAGTTANITPKALTISGITAAGKVYDGTTTATVSTTGISYGGLVAGDDLHVATASGSFADKNVGTAKTVTLNNSYGGTDVGNYSISDQGTTTASITQKALSVGGITAGNKTYDGATSATVSTAGATYAGLVGGDDVTVAATGAFGDKNVGTAKTVTLSSSYSGADVGNYSITNQAATTGDITPAAIIVSTTGVSKIYDGTTSANGTATLVSGSLFGSDALVGGSFAFTSKNVGAGNKTVLVSGVTVADGNGGNNYSLSYASNTASSITPRGLTISGITAGDKTYDGTSSATVSMAGAVFTGLVAGDNVTVSATGTFSDKNVANGKMVMLSSTDGGADMGNYTITNQASATANITPRIVTVDGAVAQDKPYDGNSAAVIQGAVLTPGMVLVTDSVTLVNATSGSFNNSVVGTAKTVTAAMALGGTDAGNYSLVEPVGLSASITGTMPATTTSSPAPVAPDPTQIVRFPDPVPLPGSTPSLPGPNPALGGLPARPNNLIMGSNIVLASASGSFSIVNTPAAASERGGDFISVRRYEPLELPLSKPFSFVLPKDTFVHSDPAATLQYSARLANGAPLPGWMRFTAGPPTRLFGTAPKGLKSIDVVIIARDGKNHEARTKLTLTFQ